MKIKFAIIIIIGSIFFSIGSVDIVKANSLHIKYYDKFSEFTKLDDKYGNPDKYLVYKYLSFDTEDDIQYVDITLGIDVDKEWYQKNNIEDIIFLRYDEGGWNRLSYSHREDRGNYIHYSVNSNKLGEYWAIIGVLPNQRDTVSGDIIIQGKTELNKINEKGVKIFEQTTPVEKMDQLIDDSKKIVITLQEPAKVKGASVAATATATLSMAALIALLNGPANFLIVLKQIVLALLGLFSTKKKLKGGIVYDVNTGRPIPLVRVDIIDKNTNKVKTTKFTNKEGRYYFLAPKGDYIVEAKKNNYKIVDIGSLEVVKSLFHKEDISREVKLNEPGVIKKNIALLREDSNVSSYGVLGFGKTIIKHLAKVLFAVGLLFNVWACYLSPTFLNFSVLAVYILVVLFRIMFLGGTKFGSITDENGAPEAFATINIFDKQTNKIVSRAVTDTKGRFYLTLDKGEYLLEIRTNGGIAVKKNIKVKKRSTLSQKIIVKNNRK